VLKIYQDSALDELFKVQRPLPFSTVVEFGQDVLREALVWTQMDHPNVLPFTGMCYLSDTSNRPCLVAPWMNDGNLPDYLKRCEMNGQPVNRLSLVRSVI
jgi:serine/threonine protein kinase